jgi:hypothetical protein
VPRRKLPEDHLGEAPIKPGDSVTVLKKWRLEIVDLQKVALVVFALICNVPQAGWNRVE